MKTRSAAQQIHLFVDPPAGTAGPIPVPHGISRVCPGDIPMLIPLDAGMGLATPAIWIEPLMNQHGLVRMLMWNSTATEVRVNGSLAPGLAVLKERDFIRFADGTAAHVGVLLRPLIGAPPPEILGRECPVCRVAFTPGTTCFQCICGTALHMEDRPDGLQCVQTRSECVCGRPIILKEGFGHTPDF